MKIYNVKNPEVLFGKFDECKGQVDIVLPDGNHCDWAKNGELVKSIWKTMPGNRVDNMEVKLQSSQDTMNMIDFLMRGNCA